MFMAGDQVWLFDLSKDLGEQKNLAKATAKMLKNYPPPVKK